MLKGFEDSGTCSSDDLGELDKKGYYSGYIVESDINEESTNLKLHHASREMPTNEVENADSDMIEEIREAHKAADEMENDDEEILGKAEGNDKNEESEMLKWKRGGD